MRCQCFCLHRELPRDISVIGYSENEVLFSLLPITKIECLPSFVDIFFCICGTNVGPGTNFAELVEPVHVLVPWSYNGMESLHSHSSVFPLYPLPSSPLTSSPALARQKHTATPWHWGCQRLPPVLGNVPPNEDLWWNVYNVGTISSLRGETKQRGVINMPFVCRTHTLLIPEPSAT